MSGKISNWVRQSRYRAKKFGAVSRIDMDGVTAVAKAFDNRCAYCDAQAVAFDHPFAMGTGAPNVLANVLPSCRECKTKKGSLDLVGMYENGHITSDRYIALLAGMLGRDGGAELRVHIKSITGTGS